MPRSPDIVWDLPTRITHWLLAVCVVLNLFVLESGEEPHEWTGYVAAGIIGARVLWAWFGRGRGAPARGWLPRLVHLGIWGAILALGVTGFMMGTDTYWGEDWLMQLHARISQVLEVLIVTHLLGIALDSIRYRRPTWLGMIDGRK